MCACMHLCVYVCTYMHVYIHIYYIYTCTCIFLNLQNTSCVLWIMIMASIQPFYVRNIKQDF